MLLFTRDHVASITPSVRKLRKFDKQLIKAGSSTTYSFTLTKEDLAFINKDLKSVTEPGQFDIMIGDKVVSINF